MVCMINFNSIGGLNPPRDGNGSDGLLLWNHVIASLVIVAYICIWYNSIIGMAGGMGCLEME